MRSAILRRFLIGILVGLLIAVPFSEFAFIWQGNTISRSPKTVVLNIPAGTADKVGQGVSVVPQTIDFVAGDVLLVKNNDSVIHTLGPLVIPAGSSARMALNTTGRLSYTCSFQPSKLLGLDVNEPLSLVTRLEGVVIAGFPLGMLLSLYSLILRPLKKKDATGTV